MRRRPQEKTTARIVDPQLEFARRARQEHRADKAEDNPPPPERFAAVDRDFCYSEDAE